MVVSLGDHIHVFFGAAASGSTTASPREIMRLETDGTWNGNAGLLRQARHKAQVKIVRPPVGRRGSVVKDTACYLYPLKGRAWF